METDLLYVRDYVEIEYKEEINSIRLDWDGFVSTKEFIEAMEIALENFIEKSAISFLVNQERRKILPPDASEWFINTWFPKLLKSVGTDIKVAVVVSHNLFGKISVQKNISTLENKNERIMPYKYFDTEEEAYEWLKEWYEIF